MNHRARHTLLLLAFILGLSSARVFAQGAPPDGADAAPPRAATVRGVVYEDRNANGKRDADEPGLAGVRVSNQEDVVVTGADGIYELPASDDMIVFVVKPRGFQVPERRHHLRTFERVFGPTYYSVDQGMVHLCVLDDVWWTGRKYKARFGARQLGWLAGDLALVPEDRLVVLLMHIPLPLAEDRAEVFRLIAPRAHCVSVSGHTHFQQHAFLGKKDGFNGKEPHHHFVAATACGSWWKGEPDERGIPHSTMSDGAPNGYSIVTFDKNRYSIRFKAAGRSADYQIQIFAAETIARKKLASTWIYANVFAGSARSKVEMRVDAEDAWRAMERKAGADPTYERTVRREARLDPPRGARLPNPSRTQHLWRGHLPKALARGLHVVEVRATDMFGQTYHAHRLLRVTD